MQSFRMLHVSLIVTTKQNPTVDIQKIKERNLNIALKKVIKRQRKRAREE